MASLAEWLQRALLLLPGLWSLPLSRTGERNARNLLDIGASLVWLYRHWMTPDCARTAIARALLPLVHGAHRPGAELRCEPAAAEWRSNGACWVRALASSGDEAGQRQERDYFVSLAGSVFSSPETNANSA